MHLTERQSEIVDRLVAGESAKAIAAQLGISPKTVYAHIGNISGKLPGSDPPIRRLIRWKLSTGRVA